MENIVVGLVVTCDAISGKDKLKRCEIDIGQGGTIMVVTNAPNVRESSRVAVALPGAEIGDEVIKAGNVGGVKSEGMLCDGKMLGWAGGSVGVAAQIPSNYELGAAPPATKPRGDGAPTAVLSTEPEISAKELKKLEKEKKKAALAEKRALRKAAKEAAGEGTEEDGGEEVEAEDA
jgi:tRNA-binding EMAP/Myf-like protein